LPHSGQNFELTGTSAPQFPHFFDVEMLAPHAGQNLDPGGTLAPQLGHFEVRAAVNGDPHSAQNLLVARF